MRKPGPDVPRPREPRPQGEAAAAELEEVERALSILEGRHPDFKRAEREMREATRRRAEAFRIEQGRARRRRAARVLLMLAVLLGLAAAGRFGVRLVAQMRDLEAGLDAASPTFEAGGFAIVASSRAIFPHTLDVETPARSCFVAITSAPAGELTVGRGAAAANHAHSIGWCSCASEHVVVKAPASATPTQGVRLLAVDARAIGGLEGWALLGARPEAFAGGGEECQEAAFVGWIADRRFPAQPLDATWIESGTGAPLERAGFHVVAGASIGRRFAVVDATPDSCLLAVHTRDPPAGDLLLLEDMDGALVARGPSLLWCTARGRPLTVRSNGATGVLVAAAPVSRVGGLLGAREWASRVGVNDPTTWAPTEDLAADAVASLRASGLPDVSPTTASSDARFKALSLPAPASIAHDPLQPDPVLECDPAIDAGALQTTCVQMGPRPWLADAGVTIGMAGAPMPFWMTVLVDERDVGALHAELELLALARRLTSERFELTMFAGVTELAPGRISVLGLAADDAIVAVEVAAEPPWAMPYSDGQGWAIDGEPREVPITVGKRVTLTASPVPEVGPKQRRTIVFRRTRAG